jgi:transcriptional regulator GlxA family with amidase domain
MARGKCQCFRASPIWMSVLNNTAKSFRRAIAAITIGLCEIRDLRFTMDTKSSEVKQFRSRLYSLLEKISKQPEYRWTVADMAKECHFSKAHFSRTFHKILRISPQHYLLEQLMRSAALSLVAPEPMPIKRLLSA